MYSTYVHIYVCVYNLKTTALNGVLELFVFTDNV